jgi:hypothetical protein
MLPSLPHLLRVKASTTKLNTTTRQKGWEEVDANTGRMMYRKNVEDNVVFSQLVMIRYF